MSVALSDREIRLLTVLRAAGSRGLSISKGHKRAGLGRLIGEKYVAKRATGEPSASLYFITDHGRQALASISIAAERS